MSDLTDLTRIREEPLNAHETERLFDRIFEGVLSEDQLRAYLEATADRRPTVEELIGAARSMRGHMREVQAPPDAIDLCGTGGDGRGTLNISTAVSFVVAAAGVPVAKHGNRAASSKSGAADILEALGVKIGLEPDEASAVLAQTGIVFLFAQTHHPAMRHVGPVRAQIKRRTIFNLLGPLASPAKVTRQLVGIFAEEWLTPYAEALKALGSTRVLVAHGKDGLDELTTTDTTYLA
ncbi:MAG TPA: anthranilate phosphoribosyltransferase, partial [Rhizomicrobium sp.]|nr:anthranilate phosphoribosyltransferase [Rhizomicrobium sp.]